MATEIEREYHRARCVVHVSTIVMYAVALLELVILVLFLCAFLEAGVSEQMSLACWLGHFAYSIVSIMMAFCLVGFLRHFYRDPLPFGARQSQRLIVAGFLLIVTIVLGGLLPNIGEIPVSNNVSPIFVSTERGGIELNAVIHAVFLFCLAYLVRYGNALKEDSDSIL